MVGQVEERRNRHQSRTAALTTAAAISTREQESQPLPQAYRIEIAAVVFSQHGEGSSENIYLKLGVNSRTQAVAQARR
jgi:hypothetical protein